METPGNWSRWETVEVEGEWSWWWESAEAGWWYGFEEKTSWWLPHTLVLSYLGSACCLWGRMRKRGPVVDSRLTTVMAGHNLVCSLLAALVLWRSQSILWRAVEEYPGSWVHILCCQRSPLTKKDLFWLITAGWSKVLHLADTYFLILRKKPVSPFHLFHHTIMLTVPMLMFPLGEPILYIFGMVNMTQHVITYPILLLKTLGISVPASGISLLALELVQMATGLFCGLYTLDVKGRGEPCLRHPRSIAYFNFLYFTMGILVVQLILKRVFEKKSKKE